MMLKLYNFFYKEIIKNGLPKKYSKMSAMSLIRGWKTEEKMKNQIPSNQNFDYFLVLDFEATCDNQTMLPVQEIIEFPVLKINSKTWDVESIFHTYVKPVVCPQISIFCTELTGIVQGQLEDQPNFTEALKLFSKWMEDEKLVQGSSFAFVTSGDWDLQTMLPNQCKTSNLSIPTYMRSWINIKKPFSTVMGIYPKGLKSMVHSLDLKFIGRPHSGIDDSKNIAQVLKALALKDFTFSFTGTV